MRLLTVMTVLMVACPAWAQTITPELRRCSEVRTPQACGASKRDLKQARRRFEAGLKFRKAGRIQQAYDAVSDAARLVPNDIEYVTAREVLRQQLVMTHLQSGNSLLLEHQRQKAAAEFREALALDPSNSFAEQRLRDAAPPISANLSNFRTEDEAGEVRVHPSTDVRDFHLRTDTRGLFQQITAAYGIRAEFDESVTPRPVRFDLGDADFWTAMRVASAMTKTFWVPLSAKQLYVIADTPTNRAQFERMAARTFYLPDATTPAELNEITSMLRTLFDIRFITQQPAQSSIVVRAPRRLLDAATKLLRSLDATRPQVMLEFQVFQISRSLLRALGLDMPLQWQAFNVTSAALAALQQPNVQNLINQLIASGGINQANTTAISALLAQLQNQQNSLLNQPFATFGGGLTRFAIPWTATTANFSRNESQVVSLQHLTVRAAQGNPATVRIGQRYPILNAIFAPIYNTSAISQVIQNNSFIAPFPSFTYEDLGIIIKATPTVHRGSISLDLNMEIKALGTQSFNGVPVITNRQYTGGLSAADGQTVIIAGTLASSEQNTLTGLPGLSRIPLLGAAVSTRNKDVSESELLVLVTPRIVHLPYPGKEEILVPATE
jgi:general secretion pathway protein D